MKPFGFLLFWIVVIGLISNHADAFKCYMCKAVGDCETSDKYGEHECTLTDACSKSTMDGKTFSRGCSSASLGLKDGDCAKKGEEEVCYYVCDSELCNRASSKAGSLWVYVVCAAVLFLF